MHISQIFQLFAQGAVKLGNNDTKLPKLNATDVIVNVLNMAYFAAGTVAVIVIILAGYSFVSSSYDPAKVAVAKNAILYSVVGIIVIMMAFAITQFIAGRF